MEYVFFCVLMCLLAVDTVLTKKILSFGGRELNPLVRWFMERFGIVGGLVLVKVPTVAAALFLLIFGYVQVLGVLCGIFGGLYGVVALWNLRVVKRVVLDVGVVST
jgi:hypothetical protein